MSAGAFPLSREDHALIEAAQAVLLRHYKPFWHTVAAALRGRDGRIWTGIHLGATVGRLSVCAEAVALGRAIMDGDGTIECAVAVRHPKPEESRGRSPSSHPAAPAGRTCSTTTPRPPSSSTRQRACAVCRSANSCHFHTSDREQNTTMDVHTS